MTDYRRHYSDVVRREEATKAQEFVASYNACIRAVKDWLNYIDQQLPNRPPKEYVQLRGRKQPLGWELWTWTSRSIVLLPGRKLAVVNVGSRRIHQSVNLQLIDKPHEAGRRKRLSGEQLHYLCMQLFQGQPLGMFETDDEKALRDRRWGIPTSNALKGSLKTF